MNVIHYAATHSNRTSSMAAQKLVYPAADRNKEPILSVLRQYIRRGSNQSFLEIASGSGQHVAYFAPHFPQVTFYPSEYDVKLLESISAHSNGMPNIEPPIKIDITKELYTWGNGTFKENSFDYIYNANMMHIMPYAGTIGLFENSGKLLKSDGLLFTYGPYAINGKITPESNVNFDKTLKMQDPEWGLRDVKQLEKLAKENGIQLVEMVDMPANNKTIIWKKY
ncbi:methyltransferase-like 26 isoform X2 [Cephus cinctus]|uniref:Methyltransferase-like 26 isoform X2 n=1 Tax=Cephus cinctus TaxID=211228 RepID=A0AAJ7BXV0_CEPCN|nr:methyltransferase-like 26 isoform X2 [Cephus cinctus]XP_015596612.1 methyltransferase-like 26 isoform X2 [Cephus cinctus]